MDGGDGAVQGIEGRHVSPVVGELRRPVRHRCHRLRRAEAGHSAVAVAHDRRHSGDEASEREADSGRAILRSEDAAVDRARHWRRGAGDAAIGRRRQGGDRLHRVVRLRRQLGRGRHQAHRS